MFLSQMQLIITVYVLALVAPSFVASLAISSNPTTIPATLPLTSPAHTLAPRTTTCGTGYCPQGSTCCSNNTCCPSSTLCTRTPSNVVGCCPVGTVCDGTPAGYGEEVDGGSMSTGDQPEGQDEDDIAFLGDESGKNQTMASNTVNDDVDTDAANDDTDTSEIRVDAADTTATAVAAETTTTTAAAVQDVGAATIIGAVVGGIVGWMALCAGLFWLHKRYRASHPKSKERALPPPPAAGMGRMAFPQGFVRIEDAASEVGIGGKAPRPYTTVYGPGARA